MKILYYITKTISYILLGPIVILAIPSAIFYFISEELEEYTFSKKYNNHIKETIVDLTYEERYDIWFKNNYETGMEKNYNIVPNFEDDYYIPTPKQKIIK